MPRPVVGLIGCGHIGRFHSRNIRAVLRSGLVEGDYAAVTDRLPDRADSFAGITGATAVGTAQRVFDTPGLSAVYVCTETAEHPDLVVDAAARGLHIFCEKPLAKTLSDVERMVAAADRARVITQVGLVLRYSPIYSVLKHLAEDPSLGPLLTAHLRDDQFFPIRGHYGSSWRGSFERAGGGTLIEHSIHDIDLFRWFFGEIDSVRCHTRNTTGHDRVEDVAMVTFQHRGGWQTTLSSIWHSIDSRASTRRFELFFENGWFATDHDFIGPIVYQRGDSAEARIEADDVLERYRELGGLDEAEFDLARRGVGEDLAFLRAVRDGTSSFPDFRTALAAHRVVDACYRSAAESREVSIGAN
jgi:predicted dehydrogenase